MRRRGAAIAMKHVVVPAAFDQHHNAALLSRLNVARVIPMHRLTSKYWLARSNKLCETKVCTEPQRRSRSAFAAIHGRAWRTSSRMH